MINREHERRWPEFQATLRQLVTDDDYNEWLKGLQFVSLSEEIEPRLILSAATSFLCSWILKVFAEDLKEAARATYGPVNTVEVYLRVIGGEPRPSRTSARVSEVDPLVARISVVSTKQKLEQPYHQPIINDIFYVVSLHYGVDEASLRSRERNDRLSIPRQVAAYLIQQLTNITLEEIGDHFGNRNDLTIAAYIRTVTMRLSYDQSLRVVIERIRADVTADSSAV